jgi:hypothetical protein
MAMRGIRCVDFVKSALFSIHKSAGKPKAGFGHAAAVLLFLAVDTASVLAKGTGPAWFDLAGSGILAISVLFGGWIIAETARRRTAVWQLLVQS